MTAAAHGASLNCFAIVERKTDMSTMRVWLLNEYEAWAAPTLLQAARACKRHSGYGWSEVIDRDAFQEIPRDEWATRELCDPETFESTTIADVVAALTEPGCVFCTEY